MERERGGPNIEWEIQPLVKKFNKGICAKLRNEEEIQKEMRSRVNREYKERDRMCKRERERE